MSNRLAKPQTENEPDTIIQANPEPIQTAPTGRHEKNVAIIEIRQNQRLEQRQPKTLTQVGTPTKTLKGAINPTADSGRIIIPGQPLIDVEAKVNNTTHEIDSGVTNTDLETTIHPRTPGNQESLGLGGIQNQKILLRPARNPTEIVVQTGNHTRDVSRFGRGVNL
jgi:hypothetical protein